MSQLKSKLEALAKSIQEQNYYSSLFETVLIRHKLTHAQFYNSKPVDALRVLNAFWFALPDLAEIRTSVFFQLCSVIELIELLSDSDNADADA